MSYASPFSGTQSGQIILTLSWDGVYLSRREEIDFARKTFLFCRWELQINNGHNFLEGLEDT